jgi:hypothetical protein
MGYFIINRINSNSLRTHFAGGIESLELESKHRFIVSANFELRTSNFKPQTSN